MKTVFSAIKFFFFEVANDYLLYNNNLNAFFLFLEKLEFDWQLAPKRIKRNERSHESQISHYFFFVVVVFLSDQRKQGVGWEMSAVLFRPHVNQTSRYTLDILTLANIYSGGIQTECVS